MSPESPGPLIFRALTDRQPDPILFQLVSERAQCIPCCGEFGGGQGCGDELVERSCPCLVGRGEYGGTVAGEADQRRASVSGVRMASDPAAGLEPIHALADRADPRGEVRGCVGNASSRVVTEVTQELILGCDKAVFGPYSVAQRVGETRLASHQVVDESHELGGFSHFMSTFPIPDDVTQTTTEVGGRTSVLVEPNGSARRAGTTLYFHRGSGVGFADRARDAGVDVMLDVVADVPHVFPAFVGRIDEAEKAIERAATHTPPHRGLKLLVLRRVTLR